MGGREEGGRGEKGGRREKAPEERVHVSPTRLSSSLCTKTRPPDVRLGEANGSTGIIIIPDC